MKLKTLFGRALIANALLAPAVWAQNPIHQTDGIGHNAFGQANSIPVSIPSPIPPGDIANSAPAPTSIGLLAQSCSDSLGSSVCDAQFDPPSCDGGCDGGACAEEGPWKLFKKPIAGFNIGGWTSVGYHSQANPLSFNTYPDKVQLGQQWLFAEKVADGSCGLGFGGRVDYLYGTDAPDTQAFGIPNNHFDNTWDNNTNAGYGHAMPQLYGEVAHCNLSVKFGRFFTIIGNEVVQSPGNFFYSRQFTFYNAEPFTHTGVLSTYKVDDGLQLYNGYVLGWDSGFEDNGDAYLGGFKKQLNDKWSFLYTTSLGRFGSGNRPVNERGGIHSAILMGSLTEKLTYINQTDMMYTKNAAGGPQRNTFGNIHYLIYQMNKCWAVGQRFEWFNFGGAGFNNVQNDDLYNYTLGLNYRPHANFVIRPEVRWVWDRTGFGFNENNSANQTAFGGDMVFTF